MTYISIHWICSTVTILFSNIEHHLFCKETKTSELIENASRWTLLCENSHSLRRLLPAGSLFMVLPTSEPVRLWMRPERRRQSGEERVRRETKDHDHLFGLWRWFTGKAVNDLFVYFISLSKRYRFGNAFTKLFARIEINQFINGTREILIVVLKAHWDTNCCTKSTLRY